MKVVIVGFKEDSLIIESQLKKEHQILGYCDCFYDRENKNVKLFSFEEINKIQYDYIILAISDLKLSSNVKDILLFEKKIDSQKILDFYKMYEASIPMMRVDKVMSNPNYPTYKGMILGISYSEVGIIPKYLSQPFCNLSVSAQDLYYNLKTLEYCISNYFHKIRNLEYVIIDMFDYTYFNYDVSLSNNAGDYLSWGGYNLDSHNFNQNKNFNFSFDQGIDYLKNLRLGGITGKDVDAWENLFTNVFSYNNYKEFTTIDNIKNRLHIISDEQIKSFNTEVSIVRNKYSNTINENIKVFDKLINTLKNLNPNIKIYTLLMPKYLEIENIESLNKENWKKVFEDIIIPFKKLYNFEHYDLKNCTEISSHRMYYQDPEHLNYLGAINFTNYLNKLIFK